MVLLISATQNLETSEAEERTEMVKRRRNSNLSALLLLSALLFSSSFSSALPFQSDELHDDDEFGLVGGKSPPDVDGDGAYAADPKPYVRNLPTASDSSSSSDSKVQFSLEHAFGDSDGEDFAPAGIFTARLRILHHGGQSLCCSRTETGLVDSVEKPGTYIRCGFTPVIVVLESSSSCEFELIPWRYLFA
ncbi:hypothetical protein ACLOJK_011768 [Asimina triloba]